MNIRKLLISLVFVLTFFTAGVYAKTLEFTISRNAVNVKEAHLIAAEELLSAPYIENDRTMVPVRVISEKLGANVGWDGAEYKVTITQNGKKIVLTIGSLEADVDGVATPLDTAPVIKNDTTMVPLRFVSETLGYDVEYVQPTSQVLVTDYPAVATVGSTKISYDVFELMYDIYLSSYYGVYGHDEIAQMTLEYLREMYAVYDSAVEFGITLDSMDNEDVLRTVSEDLQILSPSWLSSVYTDIAYKLKVVEKYSKSITQLVMHGNLDPEKFYTSKYVQVKDVYIKKSTPDAKKLAMEIAGKASRGTDFDVLMERYSQSQPDKDVIKYGYIVTDGEMPDEYIETARKLKTGEVSGIVDTTSGYYIIKKMELTPYSPEFETVIRTTAAEQSYNNFMNSTIEKARYVQNLDVAEIMKILTE